MLKIWQYEKVSILLTLAAMALIGLMFQNWVIAATLPLSSYLGWILFRLNRLENWLQRGSKLSEVSDESGLIGLITRQLYRQKKLHRNRKKRTKQLLRRLNTNIAALPDATVLLNENFEIEWFNDAATQLLNLKRADHGQRINNLIRQPEFQHYLLNPDSQNSLETHSPKNQNETLQIKIVSFGENQRLIIARNISEQKQMQLALKGFVANASHELQTPLTSIIGYLEILQMESGLSDIGQQSLCVIEQQSRRMQYLIRDLLQLSRIESYTLQPDEGDSVEIQSMMDKLLSSLSLRCNEGQLSCAFDDKLMLRANASDVSSICRNLLENALKHCPQNTPIAVSWQANRQNELVYCVKDQGAGIDEKDIPKLTQRYYRGNRTTADQVPGSGLGLAIVQQAAQRHGAKLEISSQTGQGSEFCVTFPSYRTLQPPQARLMQSTSEKAS